jgi:hypothetical protein
MEPRRLREVSPVPAEVRARNVPPRDREAREKGSVQEKRYSGSASARRSGHTSSVLSVTRPGLRQLRHGVTR